MKAAPVSRRVTSAPRFSRALNGATSGAGQQLSVLSDVVRDILDFVTRSMKIREISKSATPLQSAITLRSERVRPSAFDQWELWSPPSDFGTDRTVLQSVIVDMSTGRTAENWKIFILINFARNFKVL